MPGPTRHLGAEPNSFKWSIAKDHAYAFEAFVLQYLKRTVATRDARTKVLATPRVGDKGRDVEIQYLDPIHLFGTRVSPPPMGQSARSTLNAKLLQLTGWTMAFWWTRVSMLIDNPRSTCW